MSCDALEPLFSLENALYDLSILNLELREEYDGRDGRVKRELTDFYHASTEAIAQERHRWRNYAAILLSKELCSIRPDASCRLLDDALAGEDEETTSLGDNLSWMLHAYSSTIGADMCWSPVRNGMVLRLTKLMMDLRPYYRIQEH
jgi:hypothetical protein